MRIFARTFERFFRMFQFSSAVSVSEFDVTIIVVEVSN